MTNSSSRVLRKTEQSVVTPIQWRATAPMLPAKTELAAANSTKPGEAAGENRTALQEREHLERESYQRGFSEGKAAGREQAGAELRPVLDQLARTLASLTTLRSRIRTEAEGDLLKLAVAIARRVLHRELTLDPESIEGLIRVALEKLQARELCRVRVHPDQEAAIRSSLERFSNANKVEVTADSSMQSGDVVFETAHGDLDASIESQLQEIERGLADRLHRLPQGR
jgi:flagellar assembly protein FliH